MYIVSTSQDQFHASQKEAGIEKQLCAPGKYKMLKVLLTPLHQPGALQDKKSIVL